MTMKVKKKKTPKTIKLFLAVVFSGHHRKETHIDKRISYGRIMIYKLCISA